MYKTLMVGILVLSVLMMGAMLPSTADAKWYGGGCGGYYSYPATYYGYGYYPYYGGYCGYGSCGGYGGYGRGKRAGYGFGGFRGFGFGGRGMGY